MALSVSAWSSSLQAKLAAKGFTGTKTADFALAVATGSVAQIVGKPFATMDVGLTPGSGIGNGTGITGLSVSAISSLIFSTASGLFGSSGPKLQDLCDAVAEACVEQLGLATLTSTHTPVYLGSGTIVVGSIPIIANQMANAIQAGAPSFIGPQWPNLAQAIAVGQATGILTSGSGSVTIVGAPTGIPVPGAGAGVGVIS